MNSEHELAEIARSASEARKIVFRRTDVKRYENPRADTPYPLKYAFHLLATTEAILLDHVYTAKALAALVADVRAGKYRPGSALVFLHTGGVPAVFAEPQAVMRGM